MTAIFDLGRGTYARDERRFEVAELPPVETLRLLARLIEDQVRRATIPIVGIGISVPGIYDQQLGVARALLPLGWRDVEMADTLATEVGLDIPIRIAHDATLAALAEFRWGAGRGSQRLLLLTGQRVGVGSALIVADEQTGRSDYSLQAGHLIVDPRGPLCSCGAHGCLEVLVDGRAISEALGDRASVGSMSIAEMVAAIADCERDDRLAPLFEHLETGLVSLVNTLSPDRVVLGGLLAGLDRRNHDMLAEAISRSVVGQISPVILASSTLVEPQLTGAAELAFEPFVGSPERSVMHFPRR